MRCNARRNRLILSVLAVLWMVTLGAGPGQAAEGEGKPNFVIIYTDDQGYGDLGCFGAEGYDTPNIDRMAAEGTKFTSFYAAPVCTPARAKLMTGSYAMRVGLGHRVLFPYSEHGLHPNEVTIADALKSVGYATGCIGKWHLGHQRKFLPTNQGFDYYFGIPYSNDMGSHHYGRRDYTAPPLPLMRQTDIVDHNPEQRFLTRRYTREAVNFIKRHKDERFFLYVAHSMPHRPIDASPRFKGSTEHGLYGDVIREIDWSVGRILAVLQKHGLDEDTLVVFTTDNGPVIAPAQRLGYRTGSAGPLRGSKNTTWEGGMRVPCVMRWPEKIPRGTERDAIASVMDLLPTFAHLAGAELPEERRIDGHNIWPLMAGETSESPYDAFYYYRDERLQAVRSGKWKLHVYRPQWSRQEGEGEPQPMLYNLDEDIGEQRNVADQHPDVVERLQKLADQARQDLGDAVHDLKGQNVRPAGEL